MQYNLVTLLLAGIASAQIKGFNYGATLENGACRDQANFANLFQQAKSLSGTSGFASARLYTTIQCGTANDPTSAIQAAIDTDTSLLLGMWASAGSDAFGQEITALTRAIQSYPNLADRVIGISVGSEDLYRSSAQGVANNAGVGATASDITSYISRVRQAISGTALAGKPIGHVDTFTAWILPENAAVASAVDWLGHNSFPYFETTHANSIEVAQANFNSALAATESVSGGKPVYVTETGWPHIGPSSAEAVASVQNAETYWKSVGCELFGNRNTWWYTLEDANTAQTNILFGIANSDGSPIFDLSCNAVVQSSSSSVVPLTSTTSPSLSSTASSSALPVTQSSPLSSSSAAGFTIQTETEVSTSSPSDSSQAESTTAVIATSAPSSTDMSQPQTVVITDSSSNTPALVTSTIFTAASSQVTSTPVAVSSTAIQSAAATRVAENAAAGLAMALGALALL